MRFLSQASSTLRSLDWLLIGPSLILLVLGFAALYSIDHGQSHNFFFFRKQLVALAVGVACFAVVVRIPGFAWLKSWSRTFYLLGLLLLVAVLFFGTEVRGTRGWFTTPWFSFQPVEFAKLATVVHLAHFMERYRALRHTAWFFFGTAALVLTPALLTMLEPDAGSAVTFVVVWLSTLLVVGVPWKFFAGLCGALVCGALLFWFVFGAPYQRERVVSFLHPTHDPLGAGYNRAQAQIAVGAGGLTGRGFGFGSQSQLRFLPEARTDFIFAVIAEELGFVGVGIVFVALAALWVRMLVVARRVRDDFGALVCMGTLALLVFQSAINISMNVGLSPVAGLGLPFVSYGGSALISTLILMAAIHAIASSTQHERVRA